MRATAKFNVPKDMVCTITLSISVEEMDSLLDALKDYRQWPVGPLKDVLSQVLNKARETAYGAVETT